MTAPRVLALTGDTNASTLWRVWQPMAALERRGYAAHWAHKDDDLLPYVAATGGYDAVVLSRLSWDASMLDRAREWIAGLRDQGRRVFFECDDDMFLHLDDHLDEEQDREMVRIGRNAAATLALVDGATVSTPRLATTVRHLMPDLPVAQVPNLIDLDFFDAARKRGQRAHRALTIGWAGAKRQGRDVEPLAAAWAAIARRHPAVRFVVAGFVPELLRQAVPPERLTLLPWLPLERYPEHYASIDIGCCAVADVPFNRCKSNIKAQEFGAAGAAVVASPVLYRDVVRHLDTGLLATTAQEWEDALERLVTDAPLRRTLGRRLRRRVERDWALDTHCERWLGAWAWLLRESAERRAA